MGDEPQLQEVLSAGSVGQEPTPDQADPHRAGNDQDARHGSNAALDDAERRGDGAGHQGGEGSEIQGGQDQEDRSGIEEESRDQLPSGEHEGHRQDPDGNPLSQLLIHGSLYPCHGRQEIQRPQGEKEGGVVDHAQCGFSDHRRVD